MNHQTHFLLRKPTGEPALAPESATVSVLGPTGLRFRKRWIVYGFLGVFGGGLALIALLAAWTFLPSSEVRSLQDALGEADRRPVSTRIAFRVGWPILMPARRIAALARADENVVKALHTLRQAEVSIREYAAPAMELDRRGALDRADRALKRRGLERVVGVTDKGECVGVYVPARFDPAREVRVTVFVANQSETVIVSAVCSTVDLLGLIEHQSGLGPGGKAPGSFLKPIIPPESPNRVPNEAPGQFGRHRSGRGRGTASEDTVMPVRFPLCIGPAVL